MGCSLDKLVSNKKEKGEKEKTTLQETFPTTYTYFKKYWSHVGEDAFEMLRRKGVYPYEYIDSWDKFKETILPSIEHFYITLTDSNIFEHDYEFAKKLWEKFQLQDIGQLLADVFESFKNKSMEKYKLDPAHFKTAPSLSWAACLKKTKVKL